MEYIHFHGANFESFLRFFGFLGTEQHVWRSVFCNAWSFGDGNNIAILNRHGCIITIRSK